jgi:nicotinamidase-related amidase
MLGDGGDLLRPERGARSVALVLIGFQNDFFAPTGALRDSFEDPAQADEVLRSTVALIDAIADTDATIVSVPICFSDDYAELGPDPVGVLARIRELRAFRQHEPGAEMSAELRRFGARIEDIVGRHGFNAFRSTELDDLLRSRGVRDVFVAGALTSLCVDSTVRSALEQGYRTSVIRDCTVGRTRYEHEYFCENVFPLYAALTDARRVVELLAGTAA